MTSNNWLPRLLGLVGVTILMTSCAERPIIIHYHAPGSRSLIIHVPVTTTLPSPTVPAATDTPQPANTPTLPHTPTSSPMPTRTPTMT